MINLSIWLYGKPEWDLDLEDDNMNTEIIKEHGDYLKEHMYRVAKIVEILKLSGWSCSMALYALEFYNEKIKSEKEAKIELKKLGINPKEINIIEFEDEEDYIEE